jgi:uncharacterized protein (TIGR03086 family)
MVDIRAFDQRALKTTQSIVSHVAVDQLEAPTPCGEWTLGELLAHMVTQNYGFAAAARGESRDLSVWADRPVGDDPVGAFAASVEAVNAAFAADGTLEQGFWLPEIRDDQPFPARQAISFHVLDYVVHGWDAARAIGVRADFDDDLLDTVLAIAERVPDDENRLREGSAFRPGLDTGAVAGTDAGTDADRTTLDRILAMLGRSPNWPN